MILPEFITDRATNYRDKVLNLGRIAAKAAATVPRIAKNCKNLITDNPKTTALYAGGAAIELAKKPVTTITSLIPGFHSFASAAANKTTSLGIGLFTSMKIGPYTGAIAGLAVSDILNTPVNPLPIIGETATNVGLGTKLIHHLSSRKANQQLNKTETARAEISRQIQTIQQECHVPDIAPAAIPRHPDDPEMPPPALHMQQAKEKFARTSSNYLIVRMMHASITAGSGQRLHLDLHSETQKIVARCENEGISLWKAYKESPLRTDLRIPIMANFGFWRAIAFCFQFMLVDWVLFPILNTAIPLILSRTIDNALNVFQKPLTGEYRTDYTDTLLIKTGRALTTALDHFNLATEAFAKGKPGNQLHKLQEKEVKKLGNKYFKDLAKFIVDNFFPDFWLFKNRVVKWGLRKLFPIGIDAFWTSIQHLGAQPTSDDERLKKETDLLDYRLQIIRAANPALSAGLDFLTKPYVSAPSAGSLPGAAQMKDVFTHLMTAVRRQAAINEARDLGLEEPATREYLSKAFEKISGENLDPSALFFSFFGIGTELISRIGARSIGETLAAKMAVNPDGTYETIANFFQGFTQYLTEQAPQPAANAPHPPEQLQEKLDRLKVEYNAATQEMDQLFDQLSVAVPEFCVNDLYLGMPQEKAKMLLKQTLEEQSDKINKKLFYLSNALIEIQDRISHDDLSSASFNSILLTTSKALGEIEKVISQRTDYFPHSVRVSLSYALEPTYQNLLNTLQSIQKLKQKLETVQKLQQAIKYFASINQQTPPAELDYIYGDLKSLNIPSISDLVSVLQGKDINACLEIIESQLPAIQKQVQDELIILRKINLQAMQRVAETSASVHSIQSTHTPTFWEAVSTSQITAPVLSIIEDAAKKLRVKERAANLARAALVLVTENPALPLAVAHSAFDVLSKSEP